VTIEETINRLDDTIRRLKVQYEMFFAGSLKRQPFDLRREVEQIIHTCSNMTIRNYAHRFQFNSLVSRYNAFHQIWSKQLRAREEGSRGAPPALRSKGPSGANPGAESGEEVCFKVRIQDPAAETESMRLLYEEYLKARRSNGAGGRQLELESFVKQVARQASELREHLDCGSIEFRVLKNGDTISLKARAIPQELKS